MILQRFIEKELLHALKVFPAIGILGPRQIGKTTLAKVIQQKLKHKSVYLDMENPDDYAKIQNPTLYFQEHEKECVIIDEVQRVPELFPILRSIIDKNRKVGRFILLGSASPNLLLKSSESLAGRILYHELTPLFYHESKGEILFDKFLIRGGFPNALLAKRNADVTLWHRSFLQTYIERDLPALGLSMSPIMMNRLMQMLAHLHGSVLNYSLIAKSLGVSSPTISNALDYLENAYIIRRLPAYHTNIKKRLVKSPKLYIRDTGMVNHLLRIHDKKELLGHPSAGAIWEGFVIEQIISQLGTKYDYVYYRTQDGTESDLIILKSGLPFINIEIKFTTNPKLTQGSYQAREDLETKKNYVIIQNDEVGYFTSKKEFQIIGFTAFVENILSKL